MHAIIFGNIWKGILGRETRKNLKTQNQCAVCGHLNQNSFLAHINTTEIIFAKNLEAIALMEWILYWFLKRHREFYTFRMYIIDKHFLKCL